MFSLSPWPQKLSWLVYVAVVFILVTVAEDLITTIFHPINVWLVGTTQNSTYFPGESVPSWVNFDLIPLVLTLIIAGLTASWWVNRAQNKTKKVELELKQVEARAKRDLEAVYRDFNEKSEKEKSCHEQEINSLRTDGLNAIQENSEFQQNKLKEEQDEANILLEGQKTKYEEEISHLVKLGKNLIAQLDKFNKIKQKERLSKPKEYDLSYLSGEAITKQIRYQADVILDITTPEELLSIEAKEELKKYDK